MVQLEEVGGGRLRSGIEIRGRRGRSSWNAGMPWWSRLGGMIILSRRRRTGSKRCETGVLRCVRSGGGDRGM